jgi:hypothetical protein
MASDNASQMRIERLVRSESVVRRYLWTSSLLAVILALWVFSHEFGVFSDQPANIFGLAMWASIVLATYCWLRLRYTKLIVWQREHPVD